MNPSDDLLTYLQTCERVFEANNVENDIRIHILMNYFRQDVKDIIIRLPADALSDYANCRRELLVNFKVSPTNLRRKFSEASKQNAESFQSYVVRLRSLLNNYIESLSVKTLEDLLDVLVVDKLRDGLGHKHKLHVLNNTREQQRISARDLANLLDVYTAEFDNVDTSSGSNQNRNNARFNSSTNQKSFSARAFTLEPDNSAGIFETHSIKGDSQKLQQGSKRDKQAKPLSANKNRIRCFACNRCFACL